MPEFLDVCLEAAKRGGQVLLDWQDRFQTREKGPKDLVTEADCMAQEAIREIIHKAFPDHDFVGEEDAAERKAKGLSPIPERRSDEILLAAQSVRRMGSAALNLCYVAAGRLDAYVATSVSIWDIAAGLLLVTEAGGAVSAIDGHPLSLERPELIACASQSLAADLIQALRSANMYAIGQ